MYIYIDILQRNKHFSEPSYQVSTPTGSDDKDGPTVWLGDQKRFHFRVQAAKDAHLLLAGIPDSVEIVVGAASNSKISVLAQVKCCMGSCECLW